MTDQPSRRSFSGFAGIARRFSKHEGGNIALLFGLSMVMILTAMGAGIDLSRAYLARQKLSQVATMACQYASRPAIVDTSTASYNGSNGGTTYVSAVNAFITTTWQSQSVNLTQTNGTPFTYTQGGAANVSLSSSVPTTFMEIAGFTTIPISVQTHCFDSPASIEQRVPDSNSQYLVQESFESGAGTSSPFGWAAYLPNGTLGFQSNPTGYTSAVGYTGDHGTQWHTEGYCMEQDHSGNIKSAVYDGNFSIELDCDNGSGTKGNSSISTLVYAAAGTYELRYAYTSRVDYPSYDPTFLCGSAASDLSWANSSSTSWSGSMATAYRTNQINVYFDLNNSSTDAPPSHTTLDGTEQLAGSNLIDMCLYGMNWVQRSVTITVTTPGYYWLSFAADGTNDSFGGQIDDILLCRVSCSGSVQDNFTTAWSAGSLLFEDNFESPYYSGSPFNINGNVNNSYGSSSYETQSSNGWGNAPTNQLPYWTNGCPQSRQCIELGWNTNSLVGKPYLFVPGYYQISYDYVSLIIFATLGSTVYCGATPSAANISALSASSSTGTAPANGGSNVNTVNASGGYNVGTVNHDTNTIGLFVSHSLMASTVNRGNSMGSITSYTNPDGTTSTTPTVAPNAISLTSYNASQVNPLVDICGYSITPQTRTANILIQKPGYYWLTFSALATSDGYGGLIDDVKITALGSPYMASPPSAVTIPVPTPQPQSNINYTGFSLVADPFAP